MTIPSESMARELYELRERVKRIERSNNISRGSIIGQPLDVYDNDENLSLVIGEQYDGTVIGNPVAGPIPPTPTQPEVVATFRAAKVVWNGEYEPTLDPDDNVIDDQVVAPLDFARVEVHASMDPDFEAEFADTLVGTYETPRGGETIVPIATTGDLYYIKLVTRTQAGKRSPVSVATDVVAIEPTEPTGPTDPPEVPTTLEGYADAFGFTLVADNLDPTSIVTLWMLDPDPGSAATAIFEGTHNTVFRVSTKSDGTTPLDPAGVYEFWTSVENDIGPGPDSAHIQLQLALVTDDMVQTIAAAKVVAGDLIGAFALLGAIQVGSNISLSPDQGIVIDLADGGVIRFPADGSPAQITAELVALALTVKGALRILGTDNEIGPAATLMLNAGVSNPTQLPTVSYGWPYAQVPFLTGLKTRYVGYENTATSVVAVAKYSNDTTSSFIRLETIDSTNGAVTAIFGSPMLSWNPTLTDQSYEALGVTRFSGGGDYFVLIRSDPEGIVSNTTSVYYISRVDAATGLILYNVPLFNYSALGSSAQPAIFAYNNTYVGAVWIAGGSHTINFRLFSGPSLTGINDYVGTGYAWGGLARNVYGATKHPTDNVLMVHAAEGVSATDDWVMAFDINLAGGGNWARNQNYEYRVAYSDTDATAGSRGLTPNYSYDSSDLKLFRYTGKYTVAGGSRPSITDNFYYAWYDGNAAGTGTHTTKCGISARTTTYPNRATPIMNTPPIGEVVSTDSPDRVRAFARVSGGSSSSFDRWDGAIGVTTLWLRQDTKAASNQSLPGTNTFGAQTPAQLQSSAVDGLSENRIWMKGDGSFRLGPLKVSNAGDIVTTDEFIDPIPWTNLTVTAPWTAVVTQPPQYRRSADGTVYLRGAVTRNGATAGQSPFTVPSTARPQTYSAFSGVRTNTAGTFANLEVPPSGVALMTGFGTATAIGLEVVYSMLA